MPLQRTFLAQRFPPLWQSGVVPVFINILTAHVTYALRVSNKGDPGSLEKDLLAPHIDIEDKTYSN